MCIWGYPIDLWKHRMELNWLAWNKSAHSYMAPITIQVDPNSCPECERRSPTQPYPPQWLSTDYFPDPLCMSQCNLLSILPTYDHFICTPSPNHRLCFLSVYPSNTFSGLPTLGPPLKKPQSLPTQHQPVWSAPLGVLTWYFRRNMNSNRVRWSRVGHETIRLLAWSQQCPKMAHLCP